jgi:hypothetical protein
MVSSVEGLAGAVAVIGGSVRPLRPIGDDVAQNRNVARPKRFELLGAMMRRLVV